MNSSRTIDQCNLGVETDASSGGGAFPQNEKIDVHVPPIIEEIIEELLSGLRDTVCTCHYFRAFFAFAPCS